MSLIRRGVAIAFVCLLLNAASANAKEPTNPSIDRLIKVFTFIQNDYVVAIDMSPLAEAAVVEIGRRSGIDNASWQQCLTAENNSQRSLKLPVALKTIVHALDCANFNQKSGIEADAMVDAAVTAMVAKLNDRSEWLALNSTGLTVNTPAPASTGLSLTVQNGDFVVMGTGASTPSRQAGIEEGDLLLAVDGASTANMSLTEVIGHLRGSADSQVELTMRRGSSPARAVIINRRITSPLATAVESERYGNTLAIHVNSLPVGVGEAVQGILAGQTTSYRAIILDLRNKFRRPA
jgi:carboxyl-terminal processing protease